MGRAGRFFAAALLALAGCDARPRPPSVRALKAIVAERLPTSIPGLDAPQDHIPDQQRRIKGSPVYVDGKPVGLVRLSELPPQLEMRPEVLGDRKVPRWRMLEYLEAVGVPVARVKVAHFLGGRGRTAIIEGDGLRAAAKQVLFSFTKGPEGGKARMHWQGKLPVNTTIDSLTAVFLYVDKPPPLYDSGEHFFTWDGKKPIEGLPYVDAESEPKGTRVYVDGRLGGVLKRKILPNELLVPGYDPAKPEFSLVKWLSSIGVDPGPAAAVELIANEDVFARLDGAAWDKERGRISFYLTRRSQGKMAIHLPDDDEAVRRAADKPPREPLKVSAIEIYRRAKPPPREVKAMGDVVQNEGPGSGAAQGDGENPGNSRDRGAARGVQKDDSD